MTSAVAPEVRQEVADVLMRYASGIDRRDWPALRRCFTEDCDADYGDIGHWHSADQITNWMREIHEPCGHTLHRITNTVVEPNGDGVTARAYVDAIVLGPDNQTGAHAVGFYDDELVATDDGWKIARRRFTSVLVEMIPGGAPISLG